MDQRNGRLVGGLRVRRWILSLLFAIKKRRLERELKRLIKRNRELDAAIEAAFGEPINLTLEEKARLRALSKGISRERLKQISTLDIYDDDD